MFESSLILGVEPFLTIFLQFDVLYEICGQNLIMKGKGKAQKILCILTWGEEGEKWKKSYFRIINGWLLKQKIWWRILGYLGTKFVTPK